VLAAVAAGESSPTKIGGLLGRPATSLAHQLTTLASAGSSTAGTTCSWTDSP
jgi:hypothetical protein